jgi:hypothetical protein
MLSKESISEAVAGFFDSLKIQYKATNSKSACFIRFNESQDCNMPGYDVRITMTSLDVLGIGVIDMTIVYPVKINEQMQLTMLEFASRLNQSIPIGHFH